ISCASAAFPFTRLERGRSIPLSGLMALSFDGPERSLPQHDRRDRSNAIGDNSSFTKRWIGVARGTMDEVRSHVRLVLPPAGGNSYLRLFHLVRGSHDGRALVPIPKRSAYPASDLDVVVVDSLKALDPNRPIREVGHREKLASCQTRALKTIGNRRFYLQTG